MAVSVPAGLRARVEVSAEGATAREIRIHGSGGALIPEGWPVAGDGGQTAWITDAGASAFFDQPLYPGDNEGRSAAAIPQLRRPQRHGLLFTTVHG